jgi:SAM-dependent methyltransferase
VSNHFAVPGVARRYATGRPYIHDVVAQAIFQHTGAIGRALDVGAGTGLSTRALLRGAEQIIGIDPSVEMLDAAFRNPRVRYVAGTGECLPLSSSCIDLVTVSAAYHWCRHDALFGELERVVRPGGWIAIYDVELVGILEAPSLIGWLRNDYWAQLPRCSHFGAFDPATGPHPPFVMIAATTTSVDVPMTIDESVSFVLSQASSINAVATGARSLETLEQRLRGAFETAFPRRLAATARFDVPSFLLRRA